MCKFPTKQKYSYAQADLSITAKITTERDGLVVDTAHMANLFVLSTGSSRIDSRVGPSKFTTPLFFIVYQGWIDVQAPTGFLELSKVNSRL